MLHALAGKGDDDWLYTQAELRAIAPPLARILNRYPVTAAAAGSGDELAVLIGFGGYAMRSIQVRREAIAAERAEAGDVEPELGAPVFSTEPPAATPMMSAQLGGAQ